MKDVKILYVEDTYQDPLETDPYYEAFLKKGYKTKLVSTGEDAWKCLTSEAYDCIVLDIMLPRGEGNNMPDQILQYDSGVFLLKSLKTGKFPLNTIGRVIVASAVADLRAMETIKELYKEIPYFEKPFYPEDLTEAIEQLMGMSDR
jgi:CheY-like chemotaxis protein